MKWPLCRQQSINTTHTPILPKGGLNTEQPNTVCERHGLCGLCGVRGGDYRHEFLANAPAAALFFASCFLQPTHGQHIYFFPKDRERQKKNKRAASQRTGKKPRHKKQRKQLYIMWHYNQGAQGQRTEANLAYNITLCTRGQAQVAAASPRFPSGQPRWGGLNFIYAVRFAVQQASGSMAGLRRCFAF
jgi:hypothetical protein